MTNPPTSAAHWWQRHRHLALLLTLLLPVVVLPVLRAEGLQPRWLEALLFVLLIGMALSTVVAGRRARVWLAGTGVVAFLATGVDYAAESPGTHVICYLAFAFFLVSLSVQLLRWTLGPGRITFERIIAAICVYICLGLIWANLYGVLLLWRPDAIQFAVGEGRVPVTYFSFVTLTTLGYGDILPVHALARALAYLEAAVGPLYMAVLIARLVALEIISSHGRDDQSNSS